MGKKYNRKKFIAPLPITLSSSVYGPLPELYPHNPLSWVNFAWQYILLVNKPVPQSTVANINVIYEDGCFKVKDEGMIRLWDYGFFGKGNLSRSDPTWSGRTSRRLHLKEEGEFELSNEEITKLRREERTRFKRERAKEQELELKKRKGVLTNEEQQELAEIKTLLIEFRKSNRLKIKQEREQPIPYDDMRYEDQLVVNKDTMQLTQKEFSQLSAVEVFFLKFGLDIVDVKMDAEVVDCPKICSLKELLFECCGTRSPKPNSEFLLQYVAYHYYRSLGWCARSGIKFGCDYILYKRGPPFSHAEYAIVVLTTDDTVKKDWLELSTISRVIGSVRKTLVLCYVDVPTEDEFNELRNDDDEQWVINLLKLYKINEIVYRRWVPNKTRD